MDADNAGQLRAQLQEWIHTFTFESRIHYDYSPEWEAYQQKKWLEYDRLEARRRALGIPPSDGQAEVERLREVKARVKEKRYHPPTKELSDFAPLAIRLDEFLDQSTQDRLDSWTSMLSSWSRFQQLYTSNADFRQYLSHSQRASYHLLSDWWTTSYCDPYLVQRAQSYFHERRGVPDTKSPTDKEGLEAARSAMLDSSLYHASCFSVFLHEFHPQAWEPNICVVKSLILQTKRFNAESLALAQRISFAILFPHRKPHNLSLPPVVQNEVQRLPELGSKNEHPRYLWDVEQMKTVEFVSIAEPPEYICISHTWGRWREESLPMPGVPWDVPRNSRFTLEDLPHQLKILGYQFVWIDLFCIPQDGSAEADDEIARQASIFRGCRAAIAWLNDVESWDGVKSALAWLSLKIQRNTTKPYDSPTAEYRLVTDTELAAAAEAAGSPAELCERQGPADVPTRWFSSLWTLQEAVLCPDITLRARNWAELTDVWGAPISLRSLMVFLNQTNELCLTEGPLENSFADVPGYMGALAAHPDRPGWNERYRARPLAARSLDGVRVVTRLHNVLVDRSPAVICSVANLRYCQEKNRAPAIMSALGVTGWFKRRPSPQAPAALVLENYPLEFLREAHRTFGAAFFDTYYSTRRLDTDGEAALRRGEGLGTMLPFTETSGKSMNLIGSLDHIRIQLEDHPSVATWVICGDGSVEMTNVGCILSTSHDESRRAPLKKARGVVRFTDQFAARYEHTANMDDLLEGVAGNHGVVFALALYKRCYLVHGILLYGLKDGSTAAGRTLLKMGIFVADEWDTIESRSVAWRVL